MAEKSTKKQKSIQSYLEDVQAKTGKSVEEFRQMAADKGFTKTAPLVKWLSEEYGLGYHEAGAINYVLFHAAHASADDEGKLAHHFSGNKAQWREVCNSLLAQVRSFGNDIEIAPNTTYINLQHKGKKFGLLQTSAGRLDIGIKRKGVAATERFENAGSWNAMVTHRVKIHSANEVDDEVVEWLRQAYEAV